MIEYIDFARPNIKSKSSLGLRLTKSEKYVVNVSPFEAAQAAIED